MEIANHWAQGGEDIKGVRIARHSDAHVITNLLRDAPFVHLHADWHYPVDWLGSPGFVLLQEEYDAFGDKSMANSLFSSPLELQGCLAVAADPPPAAWVRVAAVRENARSSHILSAMFASIVDFLRQSSVRLLGWLLVEIWPDTWLHDLGFEKENYVETYIKEDFTIPTVSAVQGLVIRPVQDRDYQVLERIEANAFEPLWRHSATSLKLAERNAFSFDVAVFKGDVVAYQYSTPAQIGVHLARMTVDPAYQGRGIGTLLLEHACHGYWRKGFKKITLNTQANNNASLRLYRRFGFYYGGQRFPVWIVNL